jgi:hypothetical protein
MTAGSSLSYLLTVLSAVSSKAKESHVAEVERHGGSS